MPGRNAPPGARRSVPVGLKVPNTDLKPFVEIVPRGKQRNGFEEYVGAVDELYRRHYPGRRIELNAVLRVLVNCQSTYFETDERDVRRVDRQDAVLRKDLQDIQQRVESSYGPAAAVFSEVRADLDDLCGAIDRFLRRRLSYQKPTQPEVLLRARDELLDLGVPVHLVGPKSRCDGPLLYPLRRRKVTRKVTRKSTS